MKTKRFYILITSFCALLLLLQSCGGGAEQKTISMKADSLFIRVRCIKTVSELIEKTMLLPAQKKLEFKIEYINETYPDTITKTQAEKIILVRDIFKNYETLLDATRQLQKQSSLQMEQVNKLSIEIRNGKNENMLQYITFENKCADTLNMVLDAIIKRSIDLGCKSQNVN